MDRDNLNFGEVALKVLHERYLWKNERGEVVETPAQMLRRVADVVAQGNKNLADQFYTIMANLDFLPNSPTLMNAGREGVHGQLSACYVLDVPDRMDGIFETLKRQALIHKSGGGTGFNFSKLRARGSTVRSTNGKASGPVSFMELFDVATEKVMQGGMRRGANMGILNADHPDILDFIDAKTVDGKFPNFNISVGVTDAFMKKAESGDPEVLPIWAQIVRKARNTGDPGLVFLDMINRTNTTPHLGELTATNPCGETPLYPNEACNLGSINLANFVLPTGGIDWDRLERVVRLAVIFLDNVIDVNCYPLPEITEAVTRTRKIGLGVMGWADMLIAMGIPYDSEKARDCAGVVMRAIRASAERMSCELGLAKGPYPAFSYVRSGHAYRRNATITCIAPTGTISLLAGCSSGIEPLFALKHERKAFADSEGRGEYTFTFTHPEYEKALAAPEDTRIARGVFRTAHDIPPEGHIRMQAAFQAHTDLAVSKTVNMPESATYHDVEAAFLLAWKLGCKGTTIYRDGSKRRQVLYSLDKQGEADESACRECGGPLEYTEGCAVCRACGWSPCSI